MNSPRLPSTHSLTYAPILPPSISTSTYCPPPIQLIFSWFSVHPSTVLYPPPTHHPPAYPATYLLTYPSIHPSTIYPPIHPTSTHHPLTHSFIYATTHWPPPIHSSIQLIFSWFFMHPSTMFHPLSTHSLTYPSIHLPLTHPPIQHPHIHLFIHPPSIDPSTHHPVTHAFIHPTTHWPPPIHQTHLFMVLHAPFNHASSTTHPPSSCLSTHPTTHLSIYPPQLSTQPASQPTPTYQLPTHPSTLPSIHSPLQFTPFINVHIHPPPFFFTLV